MAVSIRIPLAQPDISEMETREVLNVLRTPYLSMGPKVLEFEERFAAFCGVRYAVAVANGTCGLHLALRATGIQAGEEVITTPFSFVATANVILFERATPVFVDVEPSTLNLTPEGVQGAIDRLYVRRNGRMVSRTTAAPLAAILPVSVFGHPLQMDGFRSLAAAYGLHLVHDACESFGSLYRSQTQGRWVSAAALADAAVYGFYPNKQITTGEGGMVATDDEAIATYCRMARNQGRDLGTARLKHDGLGFNYRMDELSAALGVAQMKRSEELLAKRDQVARWYDEALVGVEEIEPPQAEPWARVTWFVYVVRLRRGADRDAVIAYLAERGITARVYFPAIHLSPHFLELGFRPGDYPVAEDAADRAIALPFFTTLTREQVDEVVAVLKEGIDATLRV
jgi:perosamine synthetase